MLNNSPRTMNGMYDLTHSEDIAREGSMFRKAKHPIPQIQADEDEYMDDFKAYEDFMSNNESEDSEGGSREGGIFGSKLTPEQRQRSKEFDTQQKNFSSYNKHLKSQGKRAYDGRIDSDDDWDNYEKGFNEYVSQKDRQGGFIKDATTVDSNSTGVADTVKKGVDAIGIGKIPFVGGAAKFIAGDVVGGLADDAVNVVGHGTAAAADAIKGDTSKAAGQLKSAAMPAFNLGLTAATAGAGGVLAKGGAKAAGAAMAKTAAKEPLTLVQAGMSGLQDIQDRNIDQNNLQDNLN